MSWTFLTKHALVLLTVQRDPEATLRDIAAAVGVSERAVRNFVTDLERDGYLVRERVGRRTHYVVDPERPMRHRLSRDHTIRSLFAVLEGAEEEAAGALLDERGDLRRQLAELRRSRAREQRVLDDLRAEAARAAASLRRAADLAEGGATEGRRRGASAPTER